MKIGIIGPSKLRNNELISKVAEILKKYEVVLTPDKGSVSEYFAKEYLKVAGKKVFEVVPEDDKEFGYSWVNVELGEIINCSTWRNQPEKLNEECDVLVSLGYSVGGLIEICYSKWFRKKPVYILKEFIDVELPKELEESLDLHYIGIEELEKVLS
ncbi:MAG: hypothetical protein OQK82_04305 [Candidatus Pacearchaeota archaeon]|nr:hypothetical protein [Candidatus Pacearchaeota archaeon]